MFGYRLYVKNPGKRNEKLDHHTSNGMFFGYTVTIKNVYYIDKASNNIKIVIHGLFDEAYFTIDSNNAPLATQDVQRLGYANFDNEYKDSKFIPDATLKIKLISKRVTAPTQSTTSSMRLDIYYSGDTIAMLPRQMNPLAIDISVNPSKNTYIRLAPRIRLQ